jgi:hypothetical protein
MVDRENFQVAWQRSGNEPLTTNHQPQTANLEVGGPALQLTRPQNLLIFSQMIYPWEKSMQKFYDSDGQIYVIKLLQCVIPVGYKPR